MFGEKTHQCPKPIWQIVFATVVTKITCSKHWKALYISNYKLVPWFKKF